MDLNSILSKIGISQNLSQDIVLLLAVALLSFLFGMFIGKNRLVTVLINIYVSLAILGAVPEKYFSDYTTKLAVFLALVVAMTIFAKKLFEIPLSGSGSGYLWRVFAMSFLEIVLLLSVVISLIPKKVALSYVSPTAYEYLVSDTMRFIWLVAPLVFLIFIHKRMNR